MAKVYIHGKGPWNLWHGQGLRLPSSSQHVTEDIQLHNGWFILELVLLHLSETGLGGLGILALENDAVRDKLPKLLTV